MQFLQCCVATQSLCAAASSAYVPFRFAREFALAPKGLTTMFLTHLVGVFQQWRRYNESLRQLNQLGDRELADLGMTRGDIPRVAWESSER
jgi:uncharacterized protein YjiS (DUF1127 family)